MKRLFGWVVPLLLAAVGVALIILAQLDTGPGPGPGSSLSSIPDPTGTPVAQPTAPATSGASATPLPTPTPLPDDVIATQLQLESVGINVVVRLSTTTANDEFPDDCCAFILRGSSQPGRNTNSYIFAHAINSLFKPLWNVQLGAEVKVLMSDGSVLVYRVTEVRPNVPCPDANAPPHPNPPLALQYAGDGCEEGAAWTRPTDHERLTLQTSQGYNRNWGELVIVAEPVSTP